MKKNKIFIYGYKIGEHSHAYINAGFYKAFKYLGFEVEWISDDDDISNIDFKNSIFLAEGNSCKNMPRRKDCKYILHNVMDSSGMGKYVNIQYLTKDYWDKGEKLGYGIRLINNDAILFPWGSPLTPNEFQESDLYRDRDRKVYYIGTVDHWTVEGGNFESINKFAKIANENEFEFYYGGGFSVDFNISYMKYLRGWISEEDQEKFLKTCMFSPALQGDRQLENFMIPCRLFKAISYGGLGITNNYFAHEYFQGMTVWSNNIEELFYKAIERHKNIEKRKWLFNFVKENSTYVNNVKAILKVLL